MKKVLCFAAMAMAIFASCQKTEIVGNNDGPQEISFLAINKVPTKAPVEGTTFPENWKMNVSAYLAKVDGSITGARDYFNGTNFTNATPYWTGGQYWPLSDAILNFHAVAPVETGVSTTFADPEHVSKSVTTVTSNETNQYDVMYAVGRGTKTGNNTNPVGMAFKHAYCWIDFHFSGSNIITINNITVNGVSCDGTLTVNVGNPTSDTEALTTTAAWTGFTSQNIYVNSDGTFTLSATKTQYNKGILLIPEDPMSSFIIDYTMDGQNLTYTYTLDPAPSWEAGKRYIYNISMSPTAISINPTVEGWDGNDTNNITGNDTDITLE